MLEKFLIEFFGVTLDNKITQVSGVQFCNISPVHCIACSPPQVTRLGNQRTVIYQFFVVVLAEGSSVFFLLNPCTFFIHREQSDSCHRAGGFGGWRKKRDVK